MAVFLANISIALLIGFLAWLGVSVFGEYRVLGWFPDWPGNVGLYVQWILRNT